jgi:hypothetical protein
VTFPGLDAFVLEPAAVAGLAVFALADVEVGGLADETAEAAGADEVISFRVCQ